MPPKDKAKDQQNNAATKVFQCNLLRCLRKQEKDQEPDTHQYKEGTDAGKHFLAFESLRGTHRSQERGFLAENNVRRNG